ncbi:MAG TPA: M56 family metallopeptidase [Dokdonella sp.]
MNDLFVAGLLTSFVHAALLLALAWCVDRGALRTRPDWRELTWRTALFGGALTAAVQLGLDLPAPLRVVLPQAARETAVRVVPEASFAPAAAHASPERERPRAAAPTSLAEPADRVAATSPAAVEPVAAPPRAAFARPSWAALASCAWLAGVLIAAARLVAAWRVLARSLASAEPVDDADVLASVAALSAPAGIPTPRILVLDDLAGPIAATGARIVLPRWALELLDREQLRAMLAHETAHLVRRDPGWKLAIAAWCALLWFLPLARLARRRLDETAELCCDAWAARRLGGGRVLAECLAECAERRTGGVDTRLVAAMAQRGSPLLRRIESLIGDTSMSIHLSPARAFAAAAFLLAAATLALPGFGTPAVAQSAPLPPTAPHPPSPPGPGSLPPSPPTPPAPPQEGTHVSIRQTTTSGSGHSFSRIEYDDGGRGLSVKVEGKIAFTDRDDDVASLDAGGRASFAETTAGTQRRVEYAERGGHLERRYFVDGHEHPLDADAQAWLAGLIPRVVRETAIGAEARVKRLYAHGGAAAVLDDIARIDSDYARAVYLKQLVATAKLQPAEVTRALELVDGIRSDYERRGALAAIAAAAPLDARQQKLVLAQAEKIGSDYERAQLLVDMLPALAHDVELRRAWLHAAAGIRSDYEHRRALTALLDAGGLDEATLVEIVAAARSIGSDYERRTLLVAALRSIGDGERIAGTYGAAVAGIASDYERREALLALMQAPNFGVHGSRAVLEAADRIGSDYECREVLVALARVMPADAELIAHYRAIAGRLSDYDRGEAERALDRRRS